MDREDVVREEIGPANIIGKLVDKRLSDGIASDIVDAIDPVKVPRRTLYSKGTTKRTRRKAAAKRNQSIKMKENAKKALSDNERKLSELIRKLEAGDPNHPEYAKRLAVAKKSVSTAVELPVIARQKWNNPEFQKSMMERGHVYDPAAYRGWLPYEDAKAIQRKLVGAKSRGEYEVLVKIYGLRFLPARPDRVYEEWEGWSAFLGVMNLFGHNRKDSVDPSKYRTFYEALTFARSLKLKNLKQWQVACKSGLVPKDVPYDPHNVYPDQFVSISHWLGTDTAADRITQKVSTAQVWVMYTDGRDDAFWWAKMSEDKFEDFKNTQEIKIIRVYEFEGELAEEVWEILEENSGVYEEDVRERFVANMLQMHRIREMMDQKLKWKSPS